MRGQRPGRAGDPGHSSLQGTERYSRAREGVALRAGAVLDQALGGAPGKVAGAKRRAHPVAEMAQEWPEPSRPGGKAAGAARKRLIRPHFKQWLRPASIR